MAGRPGQESLFVVVVRMVLCTHGIVRAQAPHVQGRSQVMLDVGRWTSYFVDNEGARIREPQLSPAVAAGVFVTRPPMATPTGRYLGAVHFQRLLREPPAELLGGVVVNDIDPLDPDTPLPEITRRMATYNLVSLAVVDENDRLVGAVTVDDVLDHLLPRDWRDRDQEPMTVRQIHG